MKKTVLPVRIFRFYYDGFRSMEWGRELWMIILIKLFIMFVVLRLFFFPRFLNRFDTVSEKEEYVSNELIHRTITP
jgi:Na+/H+ antiporter NhaD/arsenite permease-like protein